MSAKGLGGGCLLAGIIRAPGLYSQLEGSWMNSKAALNWTLPIRWTFLGLGSFGGSVGGVSHLSMYHRSRNLPILGQSKSGTSSGHVFEHDNNLRNLGDVKNFACRVKSPINKLLLVAINMMGLSE